MSQIEKSIKTGSILVPRLPRTGEWAKGLGKGGRVTVNRTMYRLYKVSF